MPLEIHSPSDNEVNKADIKISKPIKMTKSEPLLCAGRFISTKFNLKTK